MAFDRMTDTSTIIGRLRTRVAQRLRGANRGQMQHYKNLTDFQDRIAGMVPKG